MFVNNQQTSNLTLSCGGNMSGKNSVKKFSSFYMSLWILQFTALFLFLGRKNFNSTDEHLMMIILITSFSVSAMVFVKLKTNISENVLNDEIRAFSVASILPTIMVLMCTSSYFWAILIGPVAVPSMLPIKKIDNLELRYKHRRVRIAFMLLSTICTMWFFLLD